jgi:hypothetical protein
LYSGRGDIPAQVTAGTSYKLLLLFTILAGLTYAAVAVGAVLTMFSRLRGGWVERRFSTASDEAAGERVALAEMQQFVDQYDASIRLRPVAGDDVAAIALLLLWPVLARPWERLWSPGLDPDRPRSWPPYLVAAAVPVGLLVLSFAPLPAAYARPDAQLAICSPLLAWQSGPGYADKVGAETDIQKLLEARDPIDAQNDFNALITITSEALRNAPPGTARGGYVAAMNDFRTAGLLLGGNKVTAALAEIQDGITADQQATRLLTGQERRCRR